MTPLARASTEDHELDRIHLDLLEGVCRTANALTAHFDFLMMELTDLSLPQFIVVRTIGDSPGPLAAIDVARTLRCSRANMSALLRRLEGRGVIRRERRKRPHRTPGRQLLYLTESGARAYWRGKRCLVDETKSLFADVGRDEKKALLALLARITSPE